MGQRVFNGAPAVRIGGVENNEDPIGPRENKSGIGNGIAIQQRRDLLIPLSAANGDNLDRLRHADLVAHEQLAKYGSHLFEPGDDLMGFFGTSVGKDTEMVGANTLPLLVGSMSACARDEGQDETA